MVVIDEGQVSIDPIRTLKKLLISKVEVEMTLWLLPASHHIRSGLTLRLSSGVITGRAKSDHKKRPKKPWKHWAAGSWHEKRNAAVSHALRNLMVGRSRRLLSKSVTSTFELLHRITNTFLATYSSAASS